MQKMSNIIFNGQSFTPIWLGGISFIPLCGGLLGHPHVLNHMVY